MSHLGFAHNPATLLHIAPFLRERRIPPLEIFKRAGVSPALLLDADGWVPRDLCFRLSEEAATVAGERFFGAAIGQRYKLSDLGTWGHAVTAASNLRHACQLASKGVGLLHRGSELRVVTFSHHTQLRFAYRGKLGTNPHQHLIGTLAVLRKIALLAGMPDAVGVRFSIPYSRGADVLEETHGTALEFGCKYDAIVIDREIVDQPLIDANSNNHSHEPPDTVAAIGALIRQRLAHGKISIENIAARQRMSVRTLQRRLRDWGFAFEEIVDDIRRTEAIKHVIAGENSAMEIAFLLGYSDQSHFTRAFKRWTGLAPRDYVKLEVDRAVAHAK